MFTVFDLGKVRSLFINLLLELLLHLPEETQKEVVVWRNLALDGVSETKARTYLVTIDVDVGGYA